MKKIIHTFENKESSKEILPKTVTFFARVIYGKMTFYPVCRNAKILTKIADRKCFRKKHIQWIKEIGFNPVMCQDPESVLQKEEVSDLKAFPDNSLVSLGNTGRVMIASQDFSQL